MNTDIYKYYFRKKVGIMGYHDQIYNMRLLINAASSTHSSCRGQKCHHEVLAGWTNKALFSEKYGTVSYCQCNITLSGDVSCNNFFLLKIDVEDLLSHPLLK